MSYTAATIGPIIDTITLGRKTSEIWGASYLFSWLMKKTIGELRKEKGAKFIVPYTDDDTLFEEKDGGIGMFHDRFILECDTITPEKVAEVFASKRDELAGMIAEAIGRPADEVKEELEGYIRFPILQVTKEVENPILGIMPLLDSAELHTPPLPKGDGSLRRFLNRNTIINSSLAKRSFGKKPSFKSIPAIAAQEVGEDIEQKEGFKNAYKYIAIVHADGDNLGKTIENQAPNDFSKRLFDFGKSAAKTLEDFGAQTIFIGGDDLLFFAPVLHKDGRTVFDLVDALSQNYTDALDAKETTLSFGISVTYYKYPLYEALERSRNALFGDAKNLEGKNAVAVSVQKHSGQSFKFTLPKNTTLYEKFTGTLKKTLDEEIALPHAIHHKIDALWPAIEAAGSEKVENIFDNFFNEDIHKKEFEEGLEKVEDLLEANGMERTRFFSMLSAIKLLRGDR